MQIALIPSFTNAGVFGIILITGILPTISSIVFIDIPAAIDKIICSFVIYGFISFNTSFKTNGFTANNIILEFLITSILLNVVLILYVSPNNLRASSFLSDTIIF